MFVWDLGQVCSSCQVFAPVDVLLHIKKKFFSPKLWLQMLTNTAYPVYQTMAASVTTVEGVFHANATAFLS